MASTQEWTYGLAYYFAFLFIIAILFSISGVFANNHDVVINDQFLSSFNNDINQSRWVDGSNESLDTIGSYSISTTFKDLFSFFFFNISFYNHGVLMNYLWIVRLIFVWFPLLMLVLTIYYSLPTVSGS